jgi:Mrp family chromosome partitioning ATPase/capsular polysaccharide biosynthesis protein
MVGSQQHESPLRDYVRVLVRRRLVVVACAVLVPAGAVVLALHQQALYRSSAKVVLSYQDLPGILSGIPNPSLYYSDPVRAAQTQIQLALSPDVAQKVLQRANLKDRTARDLIGSTKVTADPNADVLTFTVTDRSRQLAEQLANAYAAQYTVFRRAYDGTALQAALEDVNQRIAQLQSSADPTSAAYLKSLQGKREQLQTLESLQTANARILELASGATQTQPRPKRNGAVGLALGIMLGIGLAFLLEALDTRIRAGEEISERLGLPLLARVPEPPRKHQRGDDLVMIVNPNSPEAEAFRLLRTNLEFVNLERGARAIMVTSALEQEGKSTNVANLAVALARAGRRVVLADLDLRRPSVRKFFDLPAGEGLTTVVLGHVELEKALVRVALASHANQDDIPAEGNGRAPIEGVLEVLPSGPTPPNPGEFVGTPGVARLLNDLRERCDVLLIDAPPLLRVGDALTLGAAVDALIVVARPRSLRRPTLRELRRVLETCPAPALGVVLSGAAAKEAYGEPYYYYYQQARAPAPDRGQGSAQSVRERGRGR